MANISAVATIGVNVGLGAGFFFEMSDFDIGPYHVEDPIGFDMMFTATSAGGAADVSGMLDRCEGAATATYCQTGDINPGLDSLSGSILGFGVTVSGSVRFLYTVCITLDENGIRAHGLLGMAPDISVTVHIPGTEDISFAPPLVGLVYLWSL